MSWCYSAVSLGLLCHFRIFSIGTLPSPCYWLWSFCPQRNTMSHIRVHLVPKLATALRSAKYQILILIPQLLLCLLTVNWFYLNHVVVRVEGLGTQSEAWVTDRALSFMWPTGIHLVSRGRTYISPWRLYQNWSYGHKPDAVLESRRRGSDSWQLEYGHSACSQGSHSLWLLLSQVKLIKSSERQWHISVQLWTCNQS